MSYQKRAGGDKSLAGHVRQVFERSRLRVTVGALVLVLCALLVGSIVRPVGDWLEAQRFAGPGLLIIVALVLLDLVGRDRSAVQNEAMVMNRPSQLHPWFSSSLLRNHVEVVFFGYSCETLYELLSEAFGEIEDGHRSPRTIKIRMLLPDCAIPMAVPCLADSRDDYLAAREASGERTKTYTRKIANLVERLEARGLIESGEIEIRFHRMTPLVKVYLLNDDVAFWGPYPIESSTFETTDAALVEFYDFKGRRSTLFGATLADRGNDDAQTVKALQTWVNNVWETVAIAQQRISDES